MSKDGQRNQDTFLFNCLAACCSAFLVIYNVLRILCVPVTIDETGGYDGRYADSYLDLIRFTVPTANNHPLHSIIRKFTAEHFGVSPFSIRWDSLAALCLYLLFTCLISRRLFAKWPSRLSVFLLLNLHPFLFEFWGLSRGYGLAVALMTGSIYYLIRYTTDARPGQLAMSLLLAIAATYSNFALLNYFFGVVAFVPLRALLLSSHRGVRQFVKTEAPIIAAASALLAALIAWPIYRLQASGQFYYGGERGVVQDTVFSVVQWNLQMAGKDPLPVVIVSYSLTFLALLTGIYWIKQAARKQPGAACVTGLLLWLLLAVPVTSLIAQHALLQTKYLLDRTAIFFIPLYVLQFTYTACVILRTRPVTQNITLALPATYITIHFLLHMNISRTSIWWCDTNNVIVLRRMDTETAPGRKIKIGSYWQCHASINFYIRSQLSGRFSPAVYIDDQTHPTDTTMDFYYIPMPLADHLGSTYTTDTSFGFITLLRRKRAH